ncbi:hypothetical protein FKM82_007733 [Ascaphus truei]
MWTVTSLKMTPGDWSPWVTGCKGRPSCPWSTGRAGATTSSSGSEIHAAQTQKPPPFCRDAGKCQRASPPIIRERRG